MNLGQFLTIFEYIKGEYGDEVEVETFLGSGRDESEGIDTVAVYHTSNHQPPMIVVFWDGSLFNMGLTADSNYSMVLRYTDDVLEIVRRPAPIRNHFAPLHGI